MKFDITNLFDLNEQPFSGIKDSVDESFYQSYLEYVWLGWINVAYISEYASSITYNFLAEQNAEMSLFRTLAQEEKEHRDILGNILVKIIPSFVPPEHTAFEQSVIANIKTLNNLEQLTVFLSEELALLVPAALFYKQSTDQDKRKTLRIFLEDEGTHISGITEHFKKVFDQSSKMERLVAFRTFINKVKIRKYFCYGIVMAYLNKHNKIDLANQVFEHPWHRRHSKLLMRQYLRIAQVFQPKITAVEFDKITTTDSILIDDEFDNSFNSLYNSYVQTQRGGDLIPVVV